MGKFEEEPRWEVVELGYVGILNLCGRQGKMQIIAIDSQTEPALRRRLWEKVRGRVDKEALVVMAGDFNLLRRMRIGTGSMGCKATAILTWLNSRSSLI